MLRIKKPQPKFLSGVIRSKLRRRERRVDFIERTKYDVLLAKDEDHWDSLTVAQKDGSWAREILSAISETRAKIKKADIKSKKLADAMWNVVLRERELAAEEEKQRSSAE